MIRPERELKTLKRKESLRKKQIVIFLIVAVIFIGGGYWLGQVKEKAAGGPVTGENKAGDLTVKATGAVLQPGFYQVPPGSTVLEVIFLASPAEEADLDLLNLTEEVYNGQDISVPLKPPGQTEPVTNESQPAKKTESVGTPDRNVFSPPSGTSSKTSGAASQNGSGSVISSPAPASNSPVYGTEQPAGVSTKVYDSKKGN
jgi:hypothetical protein